MNQFAHLFEISQSLKNKIEEETNHYLIPLNFTVDEVKESVFKHLGLDIEPDQAMIGTKVEDNGGKTLIIISDKELPDFVPIVYRYEPKKGHVLADWLFYLEELCAYWDLPKKYVGG